MNGPQGALLPDGRRLHLQHGPIDLVVEAWGAPPAVDAAYARARARFEGLLDELVAELPALRSPNPGPLRGPVARRMAAAVAPFRPAFITPMAAVAGAVADAVLAAMTAGGGLERAYVNDGGDIALHLTPGTAITAAIAARAGFPDRVMVRHADAVRGIATSGWGGRSFSLGIADAVTVLAATGATADAAATVVANAVDLPGHPAVTRAPAATLQADSDLGTIPVTTAVGSLSPEEIEAALAAGAARAEALRAEGLIAAAALFLKGEVRLVGPVALAAPEPA
jgi:ApbE superfamily uncharacterized protein (UPF0280 family)